MRGFCFSSRYTLQAVGTSIQLSVEYPFERTAHNGQYLVAALRTFGSIDWMLGGALNCVNYPVL